MAMFVNRFPRKRKNIVVTVRNKNNKVNTDFQKLIKTRPNTTSRKICKASVSTNDTTPETTSSP